MKNKKGIIREWVESILIAAALAIFLRTFFFQIYQIPTASMVPTLMPHDKIFVSKLVYGPKVPFTSYRIPGVRKPKRADVVVFVPPEEKQKPWFRRKQYIKRLIGLGGDTVMIKGGNVYINGKVVVDPSIARNYYFNQGNFESYNFQMTVPDGTYFFLGDNSMHSYDGRFWGVVDEKDIIGKVELLESKT